MKKFQTETLPMCWYFVVEKKSIGPHPIDVIEKLFRAGKLSRNTFVWREGMPDWAPLESVDEFKKQLNLVSPPPIPGVQPTASANEGSLEVESDRDSLPEKPDIIEGTRDYQPEIEGTGDYQPENNQHGFALEQDRKVSGPWSRYFARMFDINVTAFAVGVLVVMGLPYISLDAALALAKMNDNLFGLVVLPFAFMLNAIILTVCGNSPGKAIFGLQANPIDSRKSFSFLGNLKREMRVWIGGIAMGIPFIAIFTMIANYREVRLGRPAIYDRQTAKVISEPITAARRATGMFVSIALLVGTSLIAVWDRVQTESSKAWKNPISGISTTIPSGWFADSVTQKNGAHLYYFTAADSSKAIYIGAETSKLADRISVGQYAKAIERNIADSVRFNGRWRSVSVAGLEMVRNDGREIKNGFPASYLITKDGNRFWRIFILKFDKADNTNIENMQITLALLRTL